MEKKESFYHRISLCAQRTFSHFAEDNCIKTEHKAWIYDLLTLPKKTEFKPATLKNGNNAIFIKHPLLVKPCRIKHPYST